MHSEQYACFASEARTRVVVAGRRYGKTELGSMWALAGAMDDRLRGISGVTWWVAPTFQLTRPVWRKMVRLAPEGWVTKTHGSEAAPDFLELGPARIEFKTAEHPERLVAEGLRRVVIDECGIIREQVWTESIMPALIDHKAPALLEGTPKGRNWFWRMWCRGKDPDDGEVESFGGSSFANPFIEREEIERLATEMPERLYRQEIMAEFLDDEGAVFRGHRECAMSYSSEPTVAIGVDLARKVDFTVLVGFDADARPTFFDRFRDISWPMQKDRIFSHWKRTDAHVVIDASGVGDSPTQDLEKAGVDIEPFIFTAQSKQNLVESLAIAIEQREIGLPNEPVLMNEFDLYEFTPTKTGRIRYGAPEGYHDDCIMSVGLALHALRNGRREIWLA